MDINCFHKSHYKLNGVALGSDPKHLRPVPIDRKGRERIFAMVQPGLQSDHPPLAVGPIHSCDGPSTQVGVSPRRETFDPMLTVRGALARANRGLHHALRNELLLENLQLLKDTRGET